MNKLLDQMLWIIPKSDDNYFFEKRLGRRHKEGIDEYIKLKKLNIQANSEYDGLVKLAQLGNLIILNNGKSKNGYIGICIIPEVLSVKQTEFLNLIKETLEKFSFFEISIISDKEVLPLNETDMKDIDYLYDVYFSENKNKKNKI